MTAVKFQKYFSCKTCGKRHDFTAYVFAHWRDEMIHECDCGAKHSIIAGTAKQFKEGNQAL